MAKNCVFSEFQPSSFQDSTDRQWLIQRLQSEASPQACTMLAEYLSTACINLFVIQNSCFIYVYQIHVLLINRSTGQGDAGADWVVVLPRGRVCGSLLPSRFTVAGSPLRTRVAKK